MDKISEMKQFKVVNGEAKSVNTALVSMLLTQIAEKEGIVEEKEKWREEIKEESERRDKELMEKGAEECREEMRKEKQKRKEEEEKGEGGVTRFGQPRRGTGQKVKTFVCDIRNAGPDEKERSRLGVL